MSTVIDLKKITKEYRMGDQALTVLKGIDFSIASGELVSIMGASGSGKSTLMNIIGLLDQPTEGVYTLEGKDVSTLPEDERARVRNRTIGFVFQSFFLLPRLNAIQNVALPLLYQGVKTNESRQRALALLEKVGVKEYATHKPNELSGGQQQRVAIARALVNNPKLILADEPTGALDTTIGQEIMDLFTHLNREENVTVVIITHDPKIAEQCDRVVNIKDGLIVGET